MATSQRVNALNEGSDLLKVLDEFLKNPKLIDELSSEVVKLNTLTAEEEGRLHQSKILMQQKDELEKEIASQRKTLAAEKTAHEAETKKRQADCDAYVTTEKDKIDAAHADLDKRESELDDYSSRLDQRENSLKEKAAVAASLF